MHVVGRPHTAVTRHAFLFLTSPSTHGADDAIKHAPHDVMKDVPHWRGRRTRRWQAADSPRTASTAPVALPRKRRLPAPCWCAGRWADIVRGGCRPCWTCANTSSDTGTGWATERYPASYNSDHIRDTFKWPTYVTQRFDHRNWDINSSWSTQYSTRCATHQDN